MKFTKLIKITGTKKGTGKNAPLKEYEGLNIETRTEQLEQIRKLNDALVAHCTGISQRYYDEMALVCHFVIEHLAAGLQMTSLSAQKQNAEYSAFLKTHYEILDQIGKEQRRFFYNIQDKVIIPLREWRNGDYHMVRTEIGKLYQYRTKLMNHKYHDLTVQHYVYRERLQSEHDKQLLVVMNQLASIDRVHYSHMVIVVDLIAIIVEYGRAVENILAPCQENAATVFD